MGLAARVGAVGSGVARGAEGTAVARGRGEAAGVAAEVPAWALAVVSATAPWSSAVRWPDPSSAIATEATMMRRAATQAARGVQRLVSPSPEPMAARSLATPAGRARTAR